MPHRTALLAAITLAAIAAAAMVPLLGMFGVQRVLYYQQTLAALVAGTALIADFVMAAEAGPALGSPPQKRDFSDLLQLIFGQIAILVLVIYGLPFLWDRFPQTFAAIDEALSFLTDALFAVFTAVGSLPELALILPVLIVALATMRYRRNFEIDSRPPA